MPVNPLPGMPETLKGDLTAERYICGTSIMKKFMNRGLRFRTRTLYPFIRHTGSRPVIGILALRFRVSLDHTNKHAPRKTMPDASVRNHPAML